MGSVRYFASTASNPWFLSLDGARAVKAITGMIFVVDQAFGRFSASVPLMPSGLMSIRITSGW